MGRCSVMAELTFYTGAMDSGKSTLALQTNHNREARGLVGRIFTAHDRAGAAVVSSRLGLAHDAIEVSPAFDFWRYAVDALTRGERIDYFVCDEAQFYTPEQIDALARIVDELEIDVFCFRAPRGWSSWPTARRSCRLRPCAGVASAPPTTRVSRTGSWSPRVRSSSWATPTIKPPRPNGRA
jgi:hypothetical protein